MPSLLQILLCSFAIMVLQSYGMWLCLRPTDRSARGHSQPAHHAFDASAVRQRINHVRGDYLGELQSRARTPDYHEALLSTTRDSIRAMDYFRDREQSGTVAEIPITAA